MGSSETELVILKVPQQTGSDDFTDELYHIQKNQRRFFSNYSKKIAEEKMLPNPFHEVSVILILKPDKDITKNKQITG